MYLVQRDTLRSEEERESLGSQAVEGAIFYLFAFVFDEDFRVIEEYIYI